MGMVYDKIEFDTELVFITPEMAEEMLTANEKNRKPADRNIEQYASDMKEGKWDIASSGIILFYFHGILKDGQHRLKAIIKSGVSMWMLIIRPSKEPSIFDKGKLRSTRDTMTVMGIEESLRNSKTIGGCRFYLNFVSPGDRKTDVQIIQYIKDHPMINMARVISQTRNVGDDSITESNFAIAAIYCALRCGVKEETLREFVRIANSGNYTDDQQTAAIWYRRTRKEKSIEKALGTQAYRTAMFRVTQEAIKDFVSGAVRKKRYRGDYNGYAEMVIDMDREKKNESDKQVHAIKEVVTEIEKHTKKDVVIKLPLNDKSEYEVTADKVEEYKELYPGVDVLQALRNMKGWCIANPSRRKTKKGIERFIHNWLSNEQNGRYKKTS